MKNNVFGLGNPLIDILVQTEDQTLTDLEIAKGSMNLVDDARQQEILTAIADQEPVTTLGGSCANSMVMIAQLGGKAAFLGNMGDDDLGKNFETQLVESGVKSCLAKTGGATGSTVILVTPDAERSMNTNLGQCQFLDESNIDLGALAGFEYLYIEGYLWDTDSQKGAVRKAIAEAKEKNVKVALTLSDSFCVGRHKEEFQQLLENDVDLVFCNEAEAEVMTGEADADDQIAQLSRFVDHVVLTLGKKGALIKKGDELAQIDPLIVKAIDTTGAGDSFAAGYLYGITNGYSTTQAGNLASCCAAKIVSQMGPRYNGDFRDLVSDYLK